MPLQYLSALLALTIINACQRGETKTTDGKSSSVMNNNSSDATPPPQVGVPTAANPIMETVGVGANARVLAIKVDYPKLYCENLRLLKTRADVNEEIGYFCNGKVPTDAFISLRAKLLEKPENNLDIIPIKLDSALEGDRSEFILYWGYYVPNRPFDVKSRPLYSYIAKPFVSPLINLAVNAGRLSDASRDSGLHIWSADMNYKMSVFGANGLALENSRNTQYNLYQVQSGNEEMGFGVESLTDKDNKDFKRTVMLNFSLNDGQGYNDGKGGTIIINCLHIIMSNRGFPSTAVEAINRVGKHLADSMYQGLTTK